MSFCVDCERRRGKVHKEERGGTFAKAGSLKNENPLEKNQNLNFR